MTNKDPVIPFEIPVVFLIYSRDKAVINNISVLRQLRASKVYLLCDYSNDENKQKEIDKIRANIEKAIDWECEVIKKYAEHNIGVYSNIALGAKWVFEKEATAIFLEDDCVTNLSFFIFCQEMLLKYEQNEKVVWINGTNYCGKSLLDNNESYGFHNQMLPCGWASWSEKFLKYYDFLLEGAESKQNLKDIKKYYFNVPLYRHQLRFFQAELDRKHSMKPFSSWDYHMIFSIMHNRLLGICPKYNLVTNIGAEESAHTRKKDLNSIMTQRFCNVPNYELEFPLIHPKEISINKQINKQQALKILPPLSLRFKGFLYRLYSRFVQKNK